MEEKLELFSFQSFAMKIIDYSKNENGTWSLSFLKYCFQEFDHLGKNDIFPFINILVNYINSDIQPLSKFKMAQFLSMLQYQSIPHLNKVYSLLAPRISDIIERVEEGPLSSATKRLLTSLINHSKSQNQISDQK